MSRFSQYDTDEERLPEGMSRVGYDADTEVYTFKDADGSYWESAPGNRYGRLTRVGEARVSEDDDDAQPFLGSEQQFRPSWRAEMMPLLNFFILVGLFLVFLFWYLHSAAKSGWSAPESNLPRRRTGLHYRLWGYLLGHCTQPRHHC
uniref:Carbohydrate-binding module family 50 protein n=1 Tax=Bionectria ochroleuca TaxID=29856 RepID=A0A8H7TT85_BIOOC